MLVSRKTIGVALNVRVKVRKRIAEPAQSLSQGSSNLLKTCDGLDKQVGSGCQPPERAGFKILVASLLKEKLYYWLALRSQKTITSLPEFFGQTKTGISLVKPEMPRKYRLLLRIGKSGNG